MTERSGIFANKPAPESASESLATLERRRVQMIKTIRYQYFTEHKDLDLLSVLHGIPSARVFRIVGYWEGGSIQ